MLRYWLQPIAIRMATMSFGMIWSDPTTRPLSESEPYPAIPPPPPPPAPQVPRSPSRRRPVRSRERPLWVRIARWVALAVVAVAVVLAGLLAHRIYDFGAAISTRAPLSTTLSTISRNSIVLLGYGGAGHDGPYLTDSILVISQNPTTGATALISVPRDLWVQVPADSGQYAKLNTAFSYGVANGGIDAGGALAAQKVSTVLGLAVPYWVSIDFTGFSGMIDKLGGVDITVPDNFTASLSPSGSPSWEFHQGPQHMDGATALLFARARYNQPAAEASDFARSLRQQILLRAIARRAKSPTEWGAISSVLDALQPNVATNLPLRDLLSILLGTNYDAATHVGLTNQNVLTDAVSSDGQDILLPRNDDWGAIQQYVSNQIGG